MPLLKHSNCQVRLNAASDLLEIYGEEATPVLKAIADSGHFPHAADARLALECASGNLLIDIRPAN